MRNAEGLSEDLGIVKGEEEKNLTDISEVELTGLRIRGREESNNLKISKSSVWVKVMLLHLRKHRRQ